MATLLENDVIRESSVLANERNIVVTLGADQTLKFKLKGMKSGEVTISINDLYAQLTGNESVNVAPKSAGSLVISNETEVVKDKPVTKKGLNAFLVELRSHNAIANFDYETKTKFEGVIKSMMDNQ